MKYKTAVLLIGFGGPTSMAEVRPFLQSVLDGVRIPQSRFDEVLRHYEIFNGVSLYNSTTYKQKKALEIWLEKSGVSIPIYVGFRHASPTFQETFEIFKKNDVEKVIGFVLSSFRCYASFERYIQKLEEGKTLAGASSIETIYTETFFKNPLFIEAHVEKLREVGAIPAWPVGRHESPLQDKTFFLFSAHSIPVPMSDENGYADQFVEASSLIAKNLKLLHWACGFQSRSGNPNDPWLSPDVKETIQRLDKTRFQNVMIIPIGFLCDNMEVLYDLDLEAKKSVETLGLKYLRASTVADHPKFIEMMGNQVLQKLEPSFVWK